MKPINLTWFLVSLVLSQLLLACSLSNSSEPAAAATRNPQEAYKILQDLYNDNGNCQLPCYWKIVPGKTLWQDASAFLSAVGQVDDPRGTSKTAKYGVFLFEWIELPIVGFTPIFWVEDGVVKAIGINSSWVSQDFDYSLSGLLQSLGKPEEIWIRPIAESSDDQPFYYLVLFYPSKGILVNLLGNAESHDQHLTLCPQDIFSRSPFAPQLLLWDPKTQVTFSHFGEELIDDDLGWVMDEYRPIQEVSANKITNAEFYNVYSEPNTETCMSVLPVR